MDPEKLKVVDLRKELQQRGLDTKGNKAVLVKRLRDALDQEASKDSKKVVPPAPEVAVKIEEQVEEPEQLEPQVVEEPKNVKKEPLRTSPKKEVAPQSPKKVVKEGAKYPEKVVKEEPKAASPVKAEVPTVETEINGEQKAGAPQKVEEESEKMEVETRGEKRKREDDDVAEEIEVKEKKRREDLPVEAITEKPPAEESFSEKSPTKSPAKSPAKKEKIPPKEDEPEIDYDKTQLSWFDSDLHLKINSKNFLSARPLNDGCFGYVWAGARATHGVSSGKVCFEVKITEQLRWEDPADKMKEKASSVNKEKFKIDRRKEEEQNKPDDKKAEDGSNVEGENEKTGDGENVEEKKPEADEQGLSEKTEAANEVPDKTTQDSEGKENKESGEKPEVEKAEGEDTKDKAEGEETKEKAEGEEAKEKAEEKPQLPPIPTHYFRVGFSLLRTTLQLGETKYSYAYESTGKFVTDKEFQDYGITFGVGDVVGAYLSIDDDNVSITFTVNGVLQSTAISVPRVEFPEGFSLFPHVLCRNYAYELNFGSREEPWFPHPEELKDYQFLQAVSEKVAGPRRPETREECEVLLMIGLPGAGKTHWVKNQLETSDKPYTVIGNHPLFDRMTVDGQPLKSRFRGAWKILVDRIQKCLNQLTDLAALRRRNYIIDQTNVFPNAQRRKLRAFDGFKRKAVILVCEDDEHARRQKDQQNDYGKSVPETTMYDLKAQMELPQKCEWIDELIFPDLSEEEARKKAKEYNEEANKKGYFKRWQARSNDKKIPPRNVRGGKRGPGFGGGRYDRFSHGSGWNRPGWGDRRNMRGPPPHGGGSGWRSSGRGLQKSQDQSRSRDNRNSGGYGSGRNQGGGRNTNVWQSGNGGYNNWGNGNSGGWNASIYGSHSYGGWSQGQQPWKFGGNQGSYSSQGQRGYGSSQGSYGYGSNQGSYGSQGAYAPNQGYNSGSQGGYGTQPGYGQQNWNYYGQYSQQQGWGNQAQSIGKSGNSANYSEQNWAQYAQQYGQQPQWPQTK